MMDLNGDGKITIDEYLDVVLGQGISLSLTYNRLKPITRALPDSWNPKVGPHSRPNRTRLASTLTVSGMAKAPPREPYTSFALKCVQGRKVVPYGMSAQKREP